MDISLCQKMETCYLWLSYIVHVIIHIPITQANLEHVLFLLRYGNEEQCGVLGEEIFLYSLCVPIVTIALLNMVFFVLTMRKMGKGWHLSKYVCKCCRRGVTADCNQLNDPRIQRLNRYVQKYRIFDSGVRCFFGVRC